MPGSHPWINHILCISRTESQCCGAHSNKALGHLHAEQHPVVQPTPHTSHQKESVFLLLDHQRDKSWLFHQRTFMLKMKQLYWLSFQDYLTILLLLTSTKTRPFFALGLFFHIISLKWQPKNSSQFCSKFGLLFNFKLKELFKRFFTLLQV